MVLRKALSRSGKVTRRAALALLIALVLALGWSARWSPGFGPYFRVPRVLAQTVYQQTCPNGMAVLSPWQIINNSNGQFIQFGCVDTFGNIAVNNQIYIPVGSTATGISAAFAELNSLPGSIYFGKGTYNMTAGITIPSSVHVSGFGVGVTNLSFTSVVNAVLLNAGTNYSSFENMTLSFDSTASVSSAGIRIACTIASVCQFNRFENLAINFTGAAANTSVGIYGSADGTGGVSLNTFSNITIQQANQMIKCDNCERDYWHAVDGHNLGWNASALMVEFGTSNDEVGDIGIETGSLNTSANICLFVSGKANLLTVVCDSSVASTQALDDTGSDNYFNLSAIGTGSNITLGTLSPTSKLSLVQASTSLTSQEFFPQVTIGSGSAITSSGVTCTMSAGTTCTATVPSGTTHCVSIAATGTTLSTARCSFSGTTLTITAGTSNSDVWFAITAP